MSILTFDEFIVFAVKWFYGETICTLKVYLLVEEIITFIKRLIDFQKLSKY